MGAGHGPGGHEATAHWPWPGTGSCPSTPCAGSPAAPPAMEGPSVLSPSSPSSREKRRSWAQQSRGWRIPPPQEEEEEEEEEEEAATATWDIPEPPPPLDSVFLEGSPSSKIQTWLRDCGSALEEEPGAPGPCACGTSGTSFEDDLTLGAEALLFPASHKAVASAPWDELLSRGHSMASSAPSSLTTRTSSSVSAVLHWWQSDAEEILYNLGFVGSEAGSASRVPSRFFSVPSRASGIDFQLFLRSQARRLEMEDPCLLLASRFQQVQALAATADAFFCLYSYVSRTPLQRIASRPYRDMPDTGGAPARPGQRLKRAVSSLSPYGTPPGNGDTQRGSHRAPPDPHSALGTGVPGVPEVPGVPAVPGLVRADPGGVAGGWRREGDTGAVPGVPACPCRCGVHPTDSCGEQKGLSPRPTPLGTAWGHLEGSCPHGPGSRDSPGARGAQGGTRDPRAGPAAPRADVTLSPTLCRPFPHASRVGVTPERPAGEGSPGVSAPHGRAGSLGCHSEGDPADPAGSDPPKTGGFQRRGGPLRLQPPGTGPSPLTQQGPVHSWELEEVLSEEEEDGEDGDDGGDGDNGAHKEATQSLYLTVRTQRNFAWLQRSHSSGFVEEPMPTQSLYLSVRTQTSSTWHRQSQSSSFVEESVPTQVPTQAPTQGQPTGTDWTS